MKKKFWIFGGLLLFAAALFLTLQNVQEAKRAGDASAMAVSDLKAQEEGASSENVPEYVLNPEMEMPVKESGDQEYIGTLDIPDLELSLPVISEWNYPRLKIAPCRYKGSAYQDNLIISAHNYPQHFGNLKDLETGAEIRFTDVEGNCFSYQVAEIEELQVTDVKKMESGEWDLTLFTCTTGGKARVTVRCDRIEEK